MTINITLGKVGVVFTLGFLVGSTVIFKNSLNVLELVNDTHDKSSKLLIINTYLYEAIVRALLGAGAGLLIAENMSKTELYGIGKAMELVLLSMAGSGILGVNPVIAGAGVILINSLVLSPKFSNFCEMVRNEINNLNRSLT